MSKSLFLPQLDGLRFLAFLAVFIHHSPSADFIPGWNLVRQHGWVGVELFFVISAYLFFHLLGAEKAKTGAIAVGNFYKRRALRILPILWVFAAAMFVLFSDHSATAAVRTAASMLGVDNMLVWIDGYSTVPYAAHLWTLSFEIQVYLVIPLAFFAHQALDRPQFLAALALVWGFCFTLRVLVSLAGAEHPIVWVSPFLRPEAVLLGLALCVARPSWPPIISASVAVASVCAIVLLPGLESPLGMIGLYPFTALAAAATVDVALRQKGVGSLLGHPTVRFLGKISFGLYVYHVLAMAVTRQAMRAAGLPVEPDTFATWLIWLTLALGTTIAMAIVSYFLFERPFLRLKAQRYSSVEGRAAAPAN